MVSLLQKPLVPKYECLLYFRKDWWVSTVQLIKWGIQVCLQSFTRKSIDWCRTSFQPNGKRPFIVFRFLYHNHRLRYDASEANGFQWQMKIIFLHCLMVKDLWVQRPFAYWNIKLELFFELNQCCWISHYTHKNNSLEHIFQAVDYSP